MALPSRACVGDLGAAGALGAGQTLRRFDRLWLLLAAWMFVQAGKDSLNSHMWASSGSPASGSGAVLRAAAAAPCRLQAAASAAPAAPASCWRPLPSACCTLQPPVAPSATRAYSILQAVLAQATNSEARQGASQLGAGRRPRLSGAQHVQHAAQQAPTHTSLGSEAKPNQCQHQITTFQRSPLPTSHNKSAARPASRPPPARRL